MSEKNVADQQMKQPDLQQILQLMVSHFSMQELKSLCFNLVVDFDELGGEGKSEKARELVAFIQRRDRLADLTRALVNERPGISWPGSDSPDIVCPYRGLFAFREADADNFFGREDVADRLSEAVARQPLLAVVGPSGSGKSSVVFAGLLPRLRQQHNWLVADFRPGANPFQALAAALLIFLEPKLSETDRLGETRKLAEALRIGDLPLNDVIARIFQKNDAGSRFLLIADQFEELYTLCPDSETRYRFLDVLLSTFATRHSPLANQHLILTLRADFMGQALAYPPLVDALQDSDMKLGPMTPKALRRVIEEPSHRAGVQFEAGLVERILDDVGTEGSNLPLLEFALTLLWEWQTRDRRLTHVAYEQIGQVKGALASHADQVLDGLSVAEQAQAQHVFVQMVQPGAGTEDTRRLARREELDDADWMLVQRLAGEEARLLVTDQDEIGQETVEVIHEALIQRWGRLRDWMESDRDFRIWQERLRAAIRQWVTSGHDEGALLRGAPLAEAEAWLAARKNDLSRDEQAFIRRSMALRQEQEEAQRQTNQQLRRRSVLATTVAIIAIIAMGVAVYFGLQANRDRLLAEARALASEAIQLAGLNPRLSLTKAYQAAHKTYEQDGLLTGEAHAALYLALAVSDQEGEIIGHTGRVNSAVFSRDGERIVTASDDNTTRLWDRQGNPLAVLEGHTDWVRSAAFSPDGERIVTASGDTTARLWDRQGNPLAVLEGHTDWINSATFPLDGEQIVTASNDTTARLWDRQGNPLAVLEGHTDWVNSAAFSPDGEQIVTASNDNTARLWDRQGNPLAVLEGHTDFVRSAAFSPDGERIVTASVDNTARLWDRQGNPLAVLEGHTDWVISATFSPDGERIVTASVDNTARLWPHYGYPLTVLEGHKDGIWSAAFSPDGERIITASGDTTARLWDRQGNPLAVLEGHRYWVISAAFSPDGERIITASDDNTARLWDRQGNPLAVLEGHMSSVISAAFSPDGERIITASADNTARLWPHYGSFDQIMAEAKRRLLLILSDEECLQYFDAAFCAGS
jgi:WD40 repeat protein